MKGHDWILKEVSKSGLRGRGGAGKNRTYLNQFNFYTLLITSCILLWDTIFVDNFYGTLMEFYEYRVCGQVQNARFVRDRSGLYFRSSHTRDLKNGACYFPA